MEEIWKDVEGFEGKYFISNIGRLKSIGGRYKKSQPNGYVTMGTVDNLGYRILTLRDHGRLKRERAHRLVALAFIEKIQGKNFVNHIDGNKLNNNYSNLEWCTHEENLRHAIKIGAFDTKGEKHFNSKLTNENVLEMRKLYWNNGLTQQAIADKFGICRRHAGDVINGVNWGWLTEPCQGLTSEPEKKKREL